MKNVLSCILVFILTFINSVYAKCNLTGLNIAGFKGWKKYSIMVDLNKKIGKKAELKIGLGYHLGEFESHARYENSSVDYIVGGQFPKAEPNYAYSLNSFKSLTNGIIIDVEQRFYFSKKITNSSPKLKKLFYGNSIAFFKIKDNYSLIFKSDGGKAYPLFYYLNGNQFFNSLRISSFFGYRLSCSRKFFLESSICFAWYIPLMKKYPAQYPFNSISSEISIGAGYYL
ncbi:MAG: hypothetical protein RJA07_194 [Bacteroidota bacterium]|jgi:hypothetical protein